MLWHLGMAAGELTVEAYAAALEPFCQAVYWLNGEDDGDWRVEGFGRMEPDAAGLKRAVAAVAAAFCEPPPGFAITALENRDWVAENQRMFPPIGAGRYFIHGSHHRLPPPPGRVVIRLDPGRAFGSGDHATTRGCLLALDRLARDRRFAAMLDMGCGSGILAIAMARSWPAGSVLAADIDRVAVSVAAGNSARNGVGRRVRTLVVNGYRSARLRRAGPYDLVVSNILANPLCRMATALSRNLNGGGVAVLSGLLIRDARRVLARHRTQGLVLVRSYDIEGWRTLVLRRPGRYGYR